MWLDELKDKYKDDRFFKEVFVDGIYAPVTKVKSDVVIDLGACAGEFSFWMYDKAKEIYAIEPQPLQAKELFASVKEYNLTKIRPFQVALADKLGLARMIGGKRGG